MSVSAWKTEETYGLLKWETVRTAPDVSILAATHVILLGFRTVSGFHFVPHKADVHKESYCSLPLVAGNSASLS